MGRRIVEERGRLEQRRRVEPLVLHEPGGPRLDENLRVRPLVAGGVRVRDDDDRQAERGHLGEGRGTGASHDEVSGGEGIEHLVAQERVRSVPLAQLDREPLAPGEGRPVGRLAGDVDDVDALHEPRQRLGDGGVEPPHLLRATEDEQEPGAGRHAEPGPRRLAVDLAGVTDRGPGQVARPATTRAGGPGAG